MSDVTLTTSDAIPDPTLGAPDRLRPHAEQAYADELAALAAVDDRPRPPRWRLSPWAVVTYLMGGTLPRRHRDHRRSTSGRAG